MAFGLATIPVRLHCICFSFSDFFPKSLALAICYLWNVDVAQQTSTSEQNINKSNAWTVAKTEEASNGDKYSEKRGLNSLNSLRETFPK